MNTSIRSQIKRQLPSPDEWRIETIAVDGTVWEARATIAVQSRAQHAAERLLRDKLKRLLR